MGHGDAQQQNVSQYLGGQCIVARHEERVAPRRLAGARAKTVRHLLVTGESHGWPALRLWRILYGVL